MDNFINSHTLTENLEFREQNLPVLESTTFSSIRLFQDKPSPNKTASVDRDRVDGDTEQETVKSTGPITLTENITDMTNSTSSPSIHPSRSKCHSHPTPGSIHPSMDKKTINENDKSKMEDLIEQLFECNNQIEELAQKRKTLTKRINDIKTELSEKMSKNGLDSIQKNGLQFNLIDVPKKPAPKRQKREKNKTVVIIEGNNK